MKFVIQYDKNNYPYWVIISANNKNICWSESYVSKQGTLNSIYLVKGNAQNAEIYEEK